MGNEEYKTIKLSKERHTELKVALARRDVQIQDFLNQVVFDMIYNNSKLIDDICAQIHARNERLSKKK